MACAARRAPSPGPSSCSQTARDSHTPRAASRARAGESRTARPDSARSSSPCSFTITASIPSIGSVQLPGLVGDRAGQRRAPRARPSPSANTCPRSGTLTRPIMLVVPDPRLRIDGLAHASPGPQARQVVPRGQIIAPLHERADRRGGGVEVRHPVPRDDVPEPIAHPFDPPPAMHREVRRPLVHQRGHAVHQQPV
jgi:hypothetical protein